MYKTTVKKNLIIFHKPNEWDIIFSKILADYGNKMAISFVLRRELGFSVRAHQGLVPHSQENLEIMGSNWPYKMHYENQIHLDFFSESAQSWFQLRYL